MLALFLLTVPRLAAARSYTVTDLGVVNGRCVEPSYINDHGQITGSFTASSGRGTAFLYGDGIADLGAPGGIYSSSSGDCINNKGEITGQYALPFLLGDKTQVYHAVVYSGGRMKDLGTLPGDTHSFGCGINNSGVVVGYVSSSKSDTTYYEALDYHQRAFLYKGGKMTALGALGGKFSVAVAINDKGDITGSAQTRRGEDYRHAFLYRAGRMSDLGALHGYDSSAGMGINNHDMVTGDVQVSASSRHAFLYDAGKMHDLGSLPGFTDSHGYGINNVGQIVGKAVAANGKDHAFLYGSGRMADLNALIPVGTGWVLETASSINDNGQIVGMGERKGERRGFLLTPKH